MVEADLQRWYGIDYQDRWRGRLSLRKIRSLVMYLPAEAATWMVLTGKPHWSLTDHLLDDLRICLTGSKEKPSKPHPQRPRPSARQVKHSPERRQKLADARSRAKQRRADIEAGRIT